MESIFNMSDLKEKILSMGDPFPVDERGFYHNMMSLIISQRIRFTAGQNIRKRIYELQDRSDLNKITELTEDERKKIKLNDQKWQIIIAFHKHHEFLKDSGLANKRLDNYVKVKGIGPWTLNNMRIMTQDYSCGFIAEDLAVRNELAKILDKDKLTKFEVNEIMSKYEKNLAGRLFSILWNKTRTKLKK